MAVFTEVNQAEAAAFLAAYGFGAPDAMTGIPQGTENTNYKLLVGGRRFILTLYEARVEKSDLPYFLGLMERLADAGLPVARPLRSKDGSTLGEIGGKPAALIEFLRGKPEMSPSPEDARRAGAALAQLHRAAEPLDLHRPNNMGPASWHDMTDAAGDKLDGFADGLHGEVARTLSLLDRQWPDDLPMGPIHADLFPDNLLLDHGEVSGIIDFYFACTDFFAYDLAVAMNAYTPETGLEVENANAEALLEGYESVRPLTGAEREKLPVLLCGSALRFFLTRAVDQIFAQAGALYVPKDPLPWLRLLRYHRARIEG